MIAEIPLSFTGRVLLPLILLLVPATALESQFDPVVRQHPTASVPPSCWEPAVDFSQLPTLWSTAGNGGDGDAFAYPPHPRLRLNDAALHALNKTINSDPTAKAYFTSLQTVGTSMLTEPLVNCSAGADLLGAARTVLLREYALSLLWRLTGDDRFAARATRELLHVTNADGEQSCASWDPFGLVLAEMTHAVGIGYDWLYDYLSPATRASIVSGVTSLGLEEAIQQYAQGAFWTK